MKKRSFFFLISFLLASSCNDYRRDSRHFFCEDDGHCITLWRTFNGIAYVIPGRYVGLTPPIKESYITSPFDVGVDIIWPKDSDSILVNIVDKSRQIIHQSPTGIKITNYNLNKRYNDSVFLYNDGAYQRYKKDVDFLTIDIKEEYAYFKDGKRVD